MTVFPDQQTWQHLVLVSAFEADGRHCPPNLLKLLRVVGALNGRASAAVEVAAGLQCVRRQPIPHGFGPRHASAQLQQESVFQQVTRNPLQSFTCEEVWVPFRLLCSYSTKLLTTLDPNPSMANIKYQSH